MAPKSRNEPSPTVPLFLLSSMVGMAFLPWLKSYISAMITALQELRGAVYLWPLLIILGISLISTVCNWMNPVPAPTTVRYPPRNRDWKAASNSTEHLQSDGSGVGLFIFLAFALVMIPWR